MARLRLHRYGVSNVRYRYLGAYRIRVVASDPDGVGTDPNVFIFLRGEPNPRTGEVFDTFEGVCGPADMSEYPVGAPAGDTAYPMFRSNEFEIDVRTVGLTDETWTTVVAEVGELLDRLEKLARLVVTAEVDVGTAAGSSSSVGSSASA